MTTWTQQIDASFRSVEAQDKVRQHDAPTRKRNPNPRRHEDGRREHGDYVAMKYGKWNETLAMQQAFKNGGVA